MSENQSFFPATTMPDAAWWQALWPDPLSVLRQVGLLPGMSAVDLCCGDGLFSVPMSVLLEGKVWGIDMDPEMLGIARQALRNAGAPECQFIEGDARDMVKLVPQKVDAVLIANTFHGVPEQTELAKCSYEVLNPGGCFIVINWHVKPREETPVLGKPRGPALEWRMSPDDVRKIVEPAGLEFEKTVQLQPHHYGAIFQRP